MKTYKPNSELQEVVGTIKQIEETMYTIKDSTKAVVENAGYKFDIVYDLSKFTVDDIDKFSDNIISNMHRKYFDSSKIDTSAIHDNIPHDTFIEITKGQLKDMVNASVEYVDIEKSYYKLIEDVSSDMDLLKKENELTDEKYEEMIDYYNKVKMESPDEEERKAAELALQELDVTKGNIDLMIGRIKMLGDKEVKRMIDNCFDSTKSMYVFNRFVDKMKRINIDTRPKSIQSLASFEENFLDKKYAPYNNFFLFSLMSHGAYINTNNAMDVLFMKSIFGKLYGCIYNNESQYVINYFKDNISRYLDMFEDYRDLFIEKNETYSEHPVFVENMNKSKEIMKTTYEKWFTENGVDISDIEVDKYPEVYKEQIIRKTTKEWLDVYEIIYDENDTTDNLVKMKENAFMKSLKDENIKKVVPCVISRNKIPHVKSAHYTANVYECEEELVEEA